MGNIIRQAVTKAYPDANVCIIHDITIDPPELDTIDILVANQFPDGLLQRCSQLQWLHLTGTGVDHLRAGRPEPDLIVTNSSTVPAQAVAEFVWMGLLALAKDAVRLFKQQEQHLWQLPNARLVSGSHMVLVGLGHIGTEIARRAASFNVKVTAITRQAQSSPLVEHVLPSEKLADAVADADSLILAVPATPATYHLVDETVIRALPSTAILINVARSTVLDTSALVHALQEGRLHGAILDVHDEEPLSPTSPLWDIDNLLITPHGAYRFFEEEQEIARLFVHNLTRWLRREELQNSVNLSALLINM
jgi:phosphoglycerate dehydrogenase-like enzyme